MNGWSDKQWKLNRGGAEQRKSRRKINYVRIDELQLVSANPRPSCCKIKMFFNDI